MSLLFALFSAFLPVFFWYLVIIRKERKTMKFFFFLIFTLSALFALLFTFYEPTIVSWCQNLGGIFLGLVLVGGIIEYGKNIILRLFAHNYFKNIDDVVDMAFATALGFTFMENVLVFYTLFQDTITYESPIKILKIMVVQDLFILPIHIVCSGVFGYYYGLSLFAKEEVKNHAFFSLFQILKGTFLSTFFYGIFFFFKEKNPMISQVLQFFGYDFLPSYLDENLLPVISFTFFMIGSVFLFYKLEQKHFLTEPLKETS